MKNLLKTWVGLVPFALFALACSKPAAEIPIQSDETPFSFTAKMGTDTRVSADLGDSQNIINFKWSTDDSLFVCFVETDSLATMTEEKAAALPTYIFKLKSGAGSSTAQFISTDFLPSEVFKTGVTYKMIAAYHPYVDDNGIIWHHLGSSSDLGIVLPKVFVDRNQVYHNDDPLKNVAQEEMLIGYPVDVSLDSAPVSISFRNRIGVFRVRVKNDSDAPINVASIGFPTSGYPITIAHYGNGLCYQFGGEGLLTCETPVTIGSSETVCFYMAYNETVSHGGTYHYDISLSNGKNIRIEKIVPETETIMFICGRMFSTTLVIKTDMLSSGEIPPITGGEEDDF